MSATAQIGLFSYGAATLAYALLSLLLTLSWRGRLAGAVLIATAILNACWAVSVAAGTVSESISLTFSGVLEALRNGAWIAFFLILLKPRRKDSANASSLARFANLGTAGLTILLILACITLEVAVRIWPIDFVITAQYGCKVITAIFGLVLTEQLYRSVPSESRWTIKFLCLGAAALFAYDLVLYADAMLFHKLDLDLWSGRGIANALIVPLITVSAARNPEWSLDVAVSRRMVFQSSALLGAGGYLLIVAAAGYYIRYFGGNWGGVLQTVLIFAGIVGLVMLALSGSLRAKLRVFVSKNFFSYRYDYREEWLRITRDLSISELDNNFGERSIRALANLVESPGGALWLQQDHQGYEVVTEWNAANLNGTVAANNPLIEFMVNRQWVVHMDEYRSGSSHYATLSLPECLLNEPEAWLIVPLISQEKLLGFVVLLRSDVRQVIDWEVNDLLKTAARQVAGYLAQLHASQALLVARQFESFNRMSAFVVHDLKNLVAQLSLLVSNASKHGNNPEFQQDMLETVENASERMKRLLTQLRVGATPVEQAVSVNLKEIVHRAVISKSPLHPMPSIQIDAPKAQALAHPERLERVVGHLLQNAAEATTPTGSIIVRIKTNHESAIIEVEDTGSGMSSEYIHNHLFRPFESTKQNGMGIGIYESREYVRELGGKLDVKSREHQGTCFRISLPLLQSETS